MDHSKKYLIVITQPADASRENLLTGLKYAVSLRNIDIETNMFLAGTGAGFVLKQTPQGSGQPQQIAEIKNYLRNFIRMQGRCYVCSSCLEEICAAAPEQKDSRYLVMDGIEGMGFAEMTELSLNCTIVSF